jgi:L-ascorbate metabolism protein UlaG (beta-lactamase superfamily)
MHDRHQYAAPASIPITREAFADQDETALYWLSSAGVLVNARGTILLVDPVLSLVSQNPPVSEERNLELLVLPPLDPHQIPRVDGVLYTHTDADHLGPLTLQVLASTGVRFFGTGFTCAFMIQAGVPAEQCSAHAPGDRFWINDVEVLVTTADHGWQVERPEEFDWHFAPEDCCGFKIKTRDGIVWIPGDTLLQGVHFGMTDADVVFLDIGNDKWHFGRSAAARLFNHLKDAEMIVYHCGTFYAPDKDYCNADPADILPLLNDPSRLKILAPGEKYRLRNRHAG